MSQNHPGGTEVPPATAIDLVVSDGPALITVPDVVGLSQAAAEAAITGVGLTVGTVTTANHATIPAGDVISQDPIGGSSVLPATPVDLVVSLGPDNQLPVADAGPDQQVLDIDGDGVETVILNGGNSMDPGGGTLTYEWHEGPTLLGTGQVLPVDLSIGMHIITLTVQNTSGDSDSDDVNIEVTSDPFADNVVLTTGFEGPDGATSATDSSASNHTLTFLGNAQIDTAESQSGGSSVLFDDLDTSYISVADSEDWNFADGEFTIETWVRFASTDSYSTLIGQAATNGNQRAWLIDWTSNQLRFIYHTDGRKKSQTVITGSWSPSPDTWYHVAVDRDSSDNLRIYVDGAIVAQATAAVSIFNSPQDVFIGLLHNGWLDDLRITKGAARYAGAFDVPNNPAAPEDVVLQSHLDGADGATTATDVSLSNHTLNFLGAAQIDTAESKFGGSSALFDDTSSSYISVADSEDWHFANGEFTIETWVRFASTDSYSTLIGQAATNGNQRAWLIDWASNQLRFIYHTDGTSGSQTILSGSWSPSPDTWYHVAVDRDSSSNLRIYVDGNVIAQTFTSVLIYNSPQDVFIGLLHDGWLDDLRITKGAAQYAGAFTPPTGAHPNPNTSLITVPDVVGQPQATAESTIVAAGLTVGAITLANHATIPAGDVISQDP
ncbi:MAG: LamG-like jellyroll fold domain-containing protein, partial [Saprospiraceae bacterium]|nr:LamG-like jellyroll fold domain-containing protein [Saprospiraceae bacterium]